MSKNVQTPIKGRRVTKSLGCHNREMLIVVPDKYGGDLDVTKWLNQDMSEEDMSGKIAALFSESVFHNGEIVIDEEV